MEEKASDQMKDKVVGSSKIEVVHDSDLVNSPPNYMPTDQKEWGLKDSTVTVDSIKSPNFQPPFYARYHVFSILASIFTIAWFTISFVFVYENLGFTDLVQLLPHELAGLVTGVLTPVALVWIFAAFFEKTRIYQNESRALKWHLQQLTYPSDGAKTRVTEITEALRSQTLTLTRASEDASMRASEATDLIKRQTMALTVATEEAGIKADSAGDKLRQQAEDLVEASDRAIARAREAGNVLHHQSHDLINVSQQAAARTEDITATLQKSGESLMRVAEESSKKAQETAKLYSERTDQFAESCREFARIFSRFNSKVRRSGT